MSIVNVYTGDIDCTMTPKEAIGKYFVSLGSKHHNFGSCFEMICWIDVSCDEMKEPFFSLIYNFELSCCKVVRQVDTKHLIKMLKSAILMFKMQIDKINNSLYNEFMLISSKRYLEELLLEYSFHQYKTMMAIKIQSYWLYHYYSPSSIICKKIKNRQFFELIEESTKRVQT